MTTGPASPSAGMPSWPGEDFEAIQVTQVDLADGLGGLHAASPDDGDLLVLVRLHGQPLGVVRLYRDRLRGDAESTRRRWCDAVVAAVGPLLGEHLQADGLATLDLWEGAPGTTLSCACRPDVPSDALPKASVVIATRERPERLEACLRSLLALDYPDFEIVVVDNDPETTATRQVVARHGGGPVEVRYAVEPRRGLAVGHNRSLSVAEGSVLAFTDDDVVVDPHWLHHLVLPFVEDPGVAASTGLILPAQLETPAQLVLEAHGSFTKGFRPASYDLRRPPPDDPLFPFTAGRLGSGANMAFEADYLRWAGGFDPALGTGSRAKGGDDLAALFGVVASGRTLAYRPAALVWHHHHRDLEAVRRQAYGYGVGLGAYLTSVLVRHPDVTPMLARRLPGGVARAFGHRSASERAAPNLLLPGGVPPELPRLQRRGMVVGPFAYLASRRSARRAAGTPA